jgi:hypothetical protein
MYTIITNHNYKKIQNILFLFNKKLSYKKKLLQPFIYKKTRKQYLSIHFRKIKIIKLYISNKKLNNTK